MPGSQALGPILRATLGRGRDVLTGRPNTASRMKHRLDKTQNMPTILGALP